jgi:hypothetical protein
MAAKETTISELAGMLERGFAESEMGTQFDHVDKQMAANHDQLRNIFSEVPSFTGASNVWRSKAQATPALPVKSTTRWSASL